MALDAAAVTASPNRRCLCHENAVDGDNPAERSAEGDGNGGPYRGGARCITRCHERQRSVKRGADR